MIVIKYSLVNIFIDDFCLNNINFIILIIITLLISASGYIINDVYDVDTDKINKKRRRVINVTISKRNAMRWYYAFNAISLILALKLCIYINYPILIIVFIFSIISLWLYSKKYKKSLLIGNLQISFLSSLCIINIILFDMMPNGININTGEGMIFRIVLYYAIFASILTLIREIIKDIEDYKGDKLTNSNTFCIKYGINKAKTLSLVLETLIIGMISLFQYFQYSIFFSKFEYNISLWGVNTVAILFTIFIQILMILLLYNTYHARNERDFNICSRLCKIIMFVGITSIPVFTYIHLN